MDNNEKKVYTYEEAFNKSLEYFEGDELAAKVFVDKYALRNENDEFVENNPEMMHRRIAKEIARIEKNKFKNPMTEDEIFSYLDHFKKIIPGGSPMYGIGNSRYVSLSNCFALESTSDSYSGICKTDQEIVQISKRRGGCGNDISELRPEGTKTTNAARKSSGIIPFMERFSNTVREVGQCLHEDTLILTENGLIKIKEININDKVWTKNKWVKVENIIKNKKSCLKIRTKHGKEIICSKDHVFHTVDAVDGEKKISEFNIGDNITQIVGEGWEGEDIIFNYNGYTKNNYNNSNRLNNDFIIPKILDEKLSYILGYSYGDGYVETQDNGANSGLSLCCSNDWEDIKYKIIKYTKEVFNCNIIIKKKKERCEDLRISSRLIIDFLEKNNILKQKAGNLIFPEILLKSKKEILFSFLSGYFDADGCVVVSKKQYKIDSIDKNLLLVFQNILSSFGIISKIRVQKRSENGKGWKDLYTLAISGEKSQSIFREKMIESIKVSSLKYKKKKQDWTATIYKISDFNSMSWKHKYIINKDQYISYSTCDLLKKDLKIEKNIYLLRDNIASIEKYEKGKKQDVYDLCLEKEHLFFANGLYAHNSGRRGALLMSLNVRHPQIIDFINSKNNTNKITGANISVGLMDDFLESVEQNKEYELRWPINSKSPIIKKNIFAKEIWNNIIENSWKYGEPGVLFLNNIISESPADCYSDLGFSTVTTNPCLTGDTLVYVANGRGNVSIKELAEKGIDVPVFCYDDNGKIQIKKMRNPRITGKNKKIYKIILEDGFEIKATENHKFRLTNGEYKQVKELKNGDSIKTLTRYESSIKDIFSKNKTSSQDYYWISDGQGSNFAEHRIIASFINNRKLKKGEIVHHIDHNGKNNSFENLKIMSKKDHDCIHVQNMFGDKNPMRRAKTEWSEEKWKEYRLKHSKNSIADNNENYSGITNEELKKHAIILTKKLGRRFSNNDWEKYAKENNLVSAFSKWRIDSIGSVLDLSILSAKECNISNIYEDPRLVKTLIKAEKQGYVSRIFNKNVLVIKKCENCGDNFEVNYFQRETGFCCHSCAGKYLNKNEIFNKKMTEIINKVYEKKSEKSKNDQLNIYTYLKYNLKRDPFLKEWEIECSKQNVPHRLKTKYGFKNFKELKNASLVFNHRIVSIEECGYEDVYNGTVDDFHNFFIGGFEGKAKNNKNKYLYVNNLNCGEVPLCAYDSCRLLSLNLYTYVKNKFMKDAYFDFETFKEDCKIAQRFQDDIIDLEEESINKILEKINRDPEPNDIKEIEKNLWTKIKDKCIRGRRTGTGLTGLADSLASLNLIYGSDESISIVDKIYKTLKLSCYRSSVDMAKELGPFPIWNFEKEKNNSFLSRIKDEDIDLYNDMKKYGRRGIALLSVAPNGTLSIMAKTSSGIEQVFSIVYTRKKKITGDINAKPDFIDKNGDKWQSFDVFHKGFLDWKNITGEYEFSKSPYYKSTAMDVDWEKSMEIQAAAQRHIDHSISKTCNIPNNSSKELVEKIFLKAWKMKLKGFTVYRDGSRDGVFTLNEDKENKEQKDDKENSITHTDAPKRPLILPCDIYYITVKGKPYFVLIGKLNNDPYEIFAGEYLDNIIDKQLKSGFIKKEKRGEYILLDPENNVVFKNISKYIDDEQEAITRLISAALRHGCNVEFIMHQLEKTKGDLMSLSKAISRVLKKYIKENAEVKGENCPECGNKLVRAEGCLKCLNCGWSRC